jgi:hypothetical protein
LLIEYFNEQNLHEKTLLLEDVETIEGVPTAKKMVMKNLLEGSETIMTIKEITYQWRPPRGFFSERNLQR